METTSNNVKILKHIFSDDIELVKEQADRLAGYSDITGKEAMAYLKAKAQEKKDIQRLSVELFNGVRHTSDGYQLHTDNAKELELIKQGKTVIGDILNTKIDNKTAFGVMVPIRKDGRIIAGLRCLYHPHHVEEVLNDHLFEGKSYFNVVDSHGNILYRSRNEKQLFQASNIFQLLQHSAFLENGSLSKLKQHLASGTEGFMRIKYKTSEHEFFYKPIGLEDWYLIAEMPEDMVKNYSSAIQMKTYLLFAQITALFGIVCIAFLYYRSRMKQTLQAKNRYFENVLNHIPLPITIVDAQHKVTFMNEKACAMSKQSLVQAHGQACCDIWHIDNCGTDNCAIKRLLNHQHSLTSFHREGSTYTVDSSILKDEKGVVNGFIEIFQDITEVVAKEEELASLINNIPGGVLMCRDDLDCTMEVISEGFLTMCGYSRKELKELFQNSLIRMMNASEQEIARKKKREIVDSGQRTIEMNYRLRTKHKGYLYIYHRGEMIQERGIKLFCNVLIDVSEREEMQRKLEQKNFELQYLTENMNGALVVTRHDASYSFLYINEGFKRFSGYGTKKTPISSYLEMLPQTYRLSIMQDIDAQLKQGETIDLEHPLLTSDHKSFWVSAKGKHIKRKGEDVIIWVLVDISEMKQKNEEIRINEERYRIAVANTQVIVFDYDVNKGCVHHDNELLANVYHIPYTLRDIPDSLRSANFLEEASLEEVIHCFESIRQGEAQAYAQIRLYKDEHKSCQWFRLKMVAIYDEAHQPKKAVGILHDISEQKKMKQLADKESTLRQTILRDSIDFYLINITQDRYLEGHEQWQKLLQRKDDSFSGINEELKCRYIHPDDGEEFQHALGRLSLMRLFHQGIHDVKHYYRRRRSCEDESYLWLCANMHMIQGDDANDILGICYIQNVTEEKKKEYALKQQAERDLLSGMYNKITTQQLIQRRLLEHEESAAMLLVDIDNFKRVNDTLGHAAGDELIHDLSSRMRLLFRRDDILGRIGGDEFIIYMSHVNEVITAEKAKSLCRHLATKISREEGEVIVSVTIGIAMMPRDGSDFDTLYRHADEALYYIKEHGKNGYEFYHHI